MGNTPICTIDQFGIHNPGLDACLAYLTNGYLGIYGADSYLGSDDQDGELIGLFSSGLDDANAMCVQAYNAYAPGTAQGVGLSQVVGINGLQRQVPTNSTVPMLLGGTFGTPIVNGLVTDPQGVDWALPATVTIPESGQITVTATCTKLGAIQAPIGTIVKMKNQTLGWQTAINTAAAVPGAPVETDPQLKARQKIATMAPASGPLDAIIAAVSEVPGVMPIAGFENDTNTLDSNGAPGHSFYIVVTGGDPMAVASAIKNSKQGGAGTYGTTTETFVDAYGVPHVIAFFYAGITQVAWGLSIVPKNGFSLNTVTLIEQSLADWTNTLSLNSGVQISRGYAAAYLQNSIQAATTLLQVDIANLASTATIAADIDAITALSAAALTYEVVLGTLTVGANGGGLGTTDIPATFNLAPTCIPASVAVAVV
jgi:uncharacterized phage protein gp47/JayE